MFAPLALAPLPAVPYLRPANLSLPIIERPQRGVTGSALDHLPAARHGMAFAGFDAPAAALQPRAGERTAALVEQYMESIGCAGRPAAAQAASGGSLKDQRAALAQQLAPPQRDILMRHMRLYCRGLASAVAEVIRRDPAKEVFARATGDNLARQGASLLAQGLFVPAPDFYRVACETKVRFEESPERVAEREQAAWRQKMGTFYRQDVRCGSTANDRTAPSVRACHRRSVTVTGPQALEQALRFLPAGRQHVYQSWESTFSLAVLHEEMRYSGSIRQYFVRQGGRNIELQLRASPGGSEYRLGDQDTWKTNPHGVTGERQEEQVTALNRMLRPGRA